MSTTELTFPQFRKYNGIDVWFKILNDKQFVEVKRLGERYILHEVVAEQYPEMLLIQDMLKCLDNRWEVAEEQEFESSYSKSKS
ncbi:hypothetical protein N8987_02050 [Crocinitomix sp.]|nr:hypothetical protein [Crocinitomix sp.]